METGLEQGRKQMEGGLRSLKLVGGVNSLFCPEWMVDI